MNAMNSLIMNEIKEMNHMNSLICTVNELNEQLIFE